MFSGVGGFELGIKRAAKDWNCVGCSEINKYAIQIYQKHFPNHNNYGNAEKINAKELPNFNLLVAGFPCQSFSIAGKRKGFADIHGTLFFEIARILKAKTPRTCLLENVKGLVNHEKGRTFKVIIQTLVKLGYSVEWQILNSKQFGVPQNRERVFIIGHFGKTGGQKIFPIRENSSNILKEITSGKSQGMRVYDTSGLSVTLSSNGGGLGAKTGLYDIDIDNNKIRRLSPIECERLQGFPDNWTAMGVEEAGHPIDISDAQRYKCLGNAVTVNVIEKIIATMIKNKII